MCAGSPPRRRHSDYIVSLFQAIANVGEYRRRLRQLMTSINDYRSLKKFPPDDWPKSLEHLEICLENDSGPLMVTPTGQIIVPSNIAIFR